MLFWAVLSLIWPALALQMTVIIVLVGGLAMFMGYEWFHMTAQLNLPKTWVERHVTTLHNQHHFRDFSKWFHVSPGGHVIDREALKKQQRIESWHASGRRAIGCRKRTVCRAVWAK